MQSVEFLKLVFRRWRAHFVIQGLPKEHHPAVLLRCKVLDTFSGTRNKWQNGNWAGNYLEHDTEFKLAVSKMRTSGDGIGQVIFTDKGKQFTTGGKLLSRFISKFRFYRFLLMRVLVQFGIRKL